ncbi:MAG: 30S ribosome-binding factor RbfA, partial [Candidatus Aenigmarchaeota archaeon]|nr:30S ribosome-binding factor RbfA [Candidatus Aenigmarchaeota archaeon]
MIHQRIKRVNELIKQEVSKIIQEELDDPRIKFLTITSVETTPDLKKATIWVSFLGENPEELLSVLVENIYKIQRFLNRRLEMKYIPRVEFKYDNSLSYAQHIEELLDEVKGEKRKR